MTHTEKLVRSLPKYKQPFLWKYVEMAEKLRAYREKQVMQRQYLHYITKTAYNKYTVFVKIQDGTEEIGTYSTEAEARQAWVEGVKFYNGIDVSPDDVPIVSSIRYPELRIRKVM